MGQRRYRSRHRQLCRQCDPPMVADDGKEAPPPNHTADDFRRRWRQQRISCASLETLQKLADELKLPITVCHLPPGTSKWNKIEHRLFSFITINWRGKPLRSYRTICPVDRRDDDRFRPHGSRRTGRKHISQRRQSLRCATGRCQSFLPLLPRRLELHDLANSTKAVTSETELTGLFMDGP